MVFQNVLKYIIGSSIVVTLGVVGVVYRQCFSNSKLSEEDRQEIMEALEDHDVTFSKGVRQHTALYSKKDNKFLAIVEARVVGNDNKRILRLRNGKGDFLGIVHYMDE